jgi:preprotein translocase subunit SecG
MKYKLFSVFMVMAILLATLLLLSEKANAGMFSSALGGAAGAALATSGLEAKVETINARIEALTRALDSVKVCKGER